MRRSNADSYVARAKSDTCGQIVLILVIVCLILLPCPASSQSSADGSQETIRILTEKIERLEKRLADVEAKQSGGSGASDKSALATAPATQTPVTAEQSPAPP